MVTGDRAVVWRDPRLRGHELLWPTIRAALSKSAVLVAVVSPRYVNSGSCREEFSNFESLSLLPDGVSIGNATRLMHVIKLPVERRTLPTAFQDRLGYSFYEPDPATGDPLELDPSKPLYFERINSVANDIRGLLSLMRRDGLAATMP